MSAGGKVLSLSVLLLLLAFHDLSLCFSLFSLASVIRNVVVGSMSRTFVWLPGIPFHPPHLYF